MDASVSQLLEVLFQAGLQFLEAWEVLHSLIRLWRRSAKERRLLLVLFELLRISARPFDFNYKHRQDRGFFCFHIVFEWQFLEQDLKVGNSPFVEEHQTPFHININFLIHICCLS